MICTEQEAAEKWCPQARTVGQVGTGSTQPRNRVFSQEAGDQHTVGGLNCLGSRCMMWEWRIIGRRFTEAEAIEAATDGWVREVDHRPREGMVFMSHERRFGTCGLINGSGP